jgi:multimeric flavodoxin WrbA
MPKIIAINSSKRKMNTYGVIEQVKEILNDNNINVEIINLFDYDIKSCVGCEKCLVKGNCIFKDDVSDIMDKIKSSDGVILTSPVYMENVSGILKTFLDRTCKWFHRPELCGKPILVIATTKGSGLKSTLKYLERVVIQWGGFNAGSIGRSIRNIDNILEFNEVEKFIEHIKMDKKLYKPSLNALIHFQVQKVLAKKVGYLDREYWEEKAWNNKVYYFKSKINPIKKLVAKSFGSFLDGVVNK